MKTKSLLGILVIMPGLCILSSGCKAGDKDKVTGHGHSPGEARSDAIIQLGRIYSSYNIVSEYPESKRNGISEASRDMGNFNSFDCSCTIYVKNAKR